MIRFEADICGDFEAATSREWLETNGIGGFASGTISGANSRRYHGLLTAATAPPLGRVTMLSKFEESIEVAGKHGELSANRYPEAIYPQGFRNLKSFRLDPFPVWTYEFAGVEIEKSVFMPHGLNTTVCRWRLLSTADGIDASSIRMTLRPLIACVDYHALQHENRNVNAQFAVRENLVSITPYGNLPTLNFSHNALAAERSGEWYINFEYSIEKERGFDCREDLFQPFVLKFNLAEPATVIVGVEELDISVADSLRADEIKRRERLVVTSGATDEIGMQLALAADQFIVSRGRGKTIIAGYPWFSDWGRDTMISLNGLTLATNRTGIARDILLEFSNHFSRGMIPNRFPDAGDTAEYNTVDATLWYFEAIRAYVEKTGDYEFVRENLYPKLAESLAWHVRGTRYGIRMDDDALLCAGETGTQLTWMDAKIGDLVFTPRIGKPVEIQALWYNALKIMSDFAGRFGDESDRLQYDSIAEKARTSFNSKFWNTEKECLFDVVTHDFNDGSVRPNQIFAVSLPHSMLSVGNARKVVQRVEADLLTPVGLRSLAVDEAEYRGIYIGSPLDRDSSYHQGTVWGWLIGPFVDAYRRVCPNTKKTEKRVAEILSGFERHLFEAGLGQISEIFDGDLPHAPRGCSAQAWSVAEVIRVRR